MLRFAGIAALGALVACASSGNGSSSASDLTNITPAPAVQQTIADCWDNATTSWIESLSTRPDGGAAVDLSEGYVDYIHWLHEITYPEYQSLNVRGEWGIAVEILRLYGWMSEADFLGETARDQYAVRHAQALTVVRNELATGQLSTPGLRADRVNVVAVLNRAWGVPDDVAATLTANFGPGIDSVLSAASDLDGTKLHRLAEITVGYDGVTPVTAADLVGLPVDPSNHYDGLRTGPYAFSQVPTPAADADMHPYLVRAARALESDVPVVMELIQDDTLDDATGTYEEPANGTLSNNAGGHLVTVFDLSVQTTAFGLIPAGTPETRPDALAATLADDSTFVSFRARNTYWGTYDPNPTFAFAGGLEGVNDYSVDYLQMPLTWQDAPRRVMGYLTLPNDPSVTLSKSPTP